MTDPSDKGSFPVAISGDGRYIVFESSSDDLVQNQVTTPPPIGFFDYQLFVCDQTTKTTLLVSHAFGKNNVTANNGIVDDLIGSAQSTGVSVADDGTVAYVSKATNLVGFSTSPNNVYLYSPGTQTNQLISTISGNPMTGAGSCPFGVVISSDASAVAYVSDASNLVPGQSAGGVDNVFRYSRLAGTTTLVSGADGSATVPGNAASGAAGFSLVINSNGQFIAFASEATNLVAGQSGAAGNVFLYNTQSQGLTLVSHVDGSATDGAGGVPDLDLGMYNITDFGGLPNGVVDPITGGGTRILSMSDDGSFVAYVSNAGDIVPQQTTTAQVATENVFLYHNTTGESTLVTGANGSAAATGDYESGFPALSGDGSLLAFHSLADNLVSGVFDGNGVSDVFTFTTSTPAVSLVSRAAFVAPPAPGDSFSTSVSADGRYTVFTSTATNLVPNQINANRNQNIFLYDHVAGTVTLLNHAPGLPDTTGDRGIYAGVHANSRLPSDLQPVISADGSFIAFASYDDNLVPYETLGFGYLGNYLQLYLYNVQTGGITLVNHIAGIPFIIDAGSLENPVVSYDGSYVAYISVFPTPSVLLYTRATDTTTSITPFTPFDLTAREWDAAIDDSGRYVAYVWRPPYNAQDNVYLFDRTSGDTILISHAAGSRTEAANRPSSGVVISRDGSYIAFVSQATDLVSGQTATSFTNVFLYNVSTGVVSLVSGANGSATVTGNSDSDSPAIDGDGSYVAYVSDATNLVQGQSGASINIFEFNTQTQAQTLVSHAADSPTTAANGFSIEPVIDDDGHLVCYVSTAGKLIPGQSGPAGVKNVYIWMRQTGANILASGQDGSPTVTGNADSDGPLLTRNSFPGFSSTASNLVAGANGTTSVAYINTLVALVLSPDTIPDGSPSGFVVGILSVSSLLDGQYYPSTPNLPAAEADNASFVLGADASGETTIATNFQANYVLRPIYQISVHVDIGFGDSSGILLVFVVPPVSPPGSATAGTKFGYTGTVHSGSTNGAAVLSANATLSNGVGTSLVTLQTAGSQTITAADAQSSSVTGSSAAIRIMAAAATHFSVSAPVSASLGTLLSVTITALDIFNNVDSGYTGRVQFSDAAAGLPPAAPLSKGVGTFLVTLFTAGSQTITATDRKSSSLNGRSGTISAGFGRLPSIVYLPPQPQPPSHAANDANTLFVGGLYPDVLGRQPDWKAALDNGSLSDALVALSFVNSVQAQKGMVDAYYLARPADTVGEPGWLHGLQSGALTLDSVAAAMLASSEYQSDVVSGIR
jgi:hypothetical protein